MTLQSRSLRLLAACAAVAGGAILAPRNTAAAGNQSAAHLHLLKSEPKANDTLAAAPSALKFWFSEPPELAVTSVKLTTADGAAVPLAPLASGGTGKDAPIVAAIRGPVSAGHYSVAWRSTAADGHPSSGRYDFVVTTH
jgi:copper resistance protein C